MATRKERSISNISDYIDISGIDRAELLAALYNNTRPVGFGTLLDLGRDMTREEAIQVLAHSGGSADETIAFTSLLGRPINVTFMRDWLKYAKLYDRECPSGAGSCAKIIQMLKQSRKK